MADANIAAIFPLTGTQEGILYHHLRGDSAGAYHQQYVAEFDQPLEPEHYRRAWQSLTDEVPVLRTLITWERRDRPLQVVRRQLSVQWRDEDWRELDEETRSRRWRELLAADRARGFALAQAPLSRFVLVRTGAQRWRWLWSFHHILLDGWSMLLLLQAAFDRYRDPASEPLAGAADYADYVRHLERRERAPAERFWRAAFADVDTLPRPFFVDERPAPSVGHYRVAHRLSAADTERLLSLCRSEQLTLGSCISGAWAVVLGRATRSETVVFGTTITDRPAGIPGLERTPGLFIHTIPAIARTPAEREVRGWLRDLQSSLAQARSHAQLTLPDIVRLSGRAPGLPLFETLLVIENLSFASIDPGGGEAAPRPGRLAPVSQQYDEHSHYPLAVLALPGERLELIAIGDAARIQQARAGQLLDALAHVLTGFAAQPAQRLGSVGLTTPLAAGPRPTQACEDGVLPAFLERVREHGTRPAVIAADRTLSYRELDAAASALATRLRDRAGGAPGPVAVMMERSAAAIVAILAVLKAGAAYAPIDPQYPSARNGEILDSLAGHGARWLLVDAPPAALAASWRVLPVDVASLLAVELPGGAATEPAPEDLAYLMFTSGSTGRPKGVMVTHANLAVSTFARDAVYGASPQRFLLLSSLATDSSVAGLFWTLTAGGALVLPPPRGQQDVAALARLMQAERVTHTLCVPSLYELLLEQLDPADHASLRCVSVAAEACPDALVSRHAMRLPRTDLVNEYGPTEATVWATAAHLVRAGTPAAVSIGTPVGAARVYLLDPAGHPVPAGWPGEIAIAGPHVARGYLGGPEAGAGAFGPDPFVPGERLYRTGDLARSGTGGELELLGRIDHQLKVRGFRVEPEEIERVLREHPGIAEAAVTLHHPPAEAPEQLLAAMQHDARAAVLLQEIETMSAAAVEQALAGAPPPSAAQDVQP